MNNIELFQMFRTIDKETNCFDKQLKLKQAIKLYKKSDYYKQTKHSIFKAYNIYKFSGIDNLLFLFSGSAFAKLAKGDITEILVALEDFVSNFDFTKLDNFFNYIDEKIGETNIEKLRNNLEDMVNKIKFIN